MRPPAGPSCGLWSGAQLPDVESTCLSELACPPSGPFFQGHWEEVTLALSLLSQHTDRLQAEQMAAGVGFPQPDYGPAATLGLQVPPRVR